MFFPAVPGYSIRPKTAPTKQILQEARKERLRDMQVSGVIRDAFMYALFLMVVLYLAYINRDPQAFLISETIRNTFVRDSIDYLVDGVSMHAHCGKCVKSVYTGYQRSSPTEIENKNNYNGGFLKHMSLSPSRHGALSPSIIPLSPWSLLATTM